MAQRNRSHWTANIRDPSLNPHRFLPTPAPAAPLSSLKKPAPKQKVVEANILRAAPSEARGPGCFCVLDRYNNYRGFISADGTCTNNANQVIGYINIDENQAGYM